MLNELKLVSGFEALFTAIPPNCVCICSPPFLFINTQPGWEWSLQPPSALIYALNEYRDGILRKFVAQCISYGRNTRTPLKGFQPKQSHILPFTHVAHKWNGYLRTSGEIKSQLPTRGEEVPRRARGWSCEWTLHCRCVGMRTTYEFTSGARYIKATSNVICRVRYKVIAMFVAEPAAQGRITWYRILIMIHSQLGG